MFSKRNRVEPSAELLDKVRYIVSYRMSLSRREGNKAAETESQPSYLRNQLACVLDELGIQVLYRKSRGILDKKSKLFHRVVERKAVRLDFVDASDSSDAGAPCAPLAVNKYEPGHWEQKLDIAYQKCQELCNEWDRVRYLETQLGTTQDAEEVVRLIEATPDPEHTIKLLALSPNYDANSFALYMAYILAGKIREAHKVLQSTVQLNPSDARLHLSLGNFYWAALCNATGWAAKTNPGPLKQITLQTLGYDYETVRNMARSQFLEALRLPHNKDIEEQANAQLSTLMTMKTR
jgi:tetratricopeptide (TPR) repeat protein